MGNLGYPTAMFDAVLCTAVLHHIPDSRGWVRALSEIKRVLKPSGFAFVTVWSNTKDKPGSDRNVGFPSGKGNKVQRFYHFFTKHELEAAARKAGLEIADAFFEAGGKKTGAKSSGKARNLCFVLQRPRRGNRLVRLR
jgi:ubiquinone/menaquinone biosynthesis C-methylase UbiE